MKQSEVNKIIGQLEKNEIRVFDIPEEYENSIEIVNFERKSGLRRTRKRGFDIISNSFFVEEDLVHTNAYDEEQIKSVLLSFDDFDSYYDFLNGDIYDNACYAFCPLFDNTIFSKKIDLTKLPERKSFIDDTIDDYSLELSREEKESYQKGEEIYTLCQQWTKKFNSCDSYKKLVKVANNYNKTKLSSILGVEFFLFQYIFADVGDEQRFSIIMEYISSGRVPYYNIIYPLCSIYDPDDVMQSFNYSQGARKAINKSKKELKEYVSLLKNTEIEFCSNAFFDKETHYYCEKMQGFKKGNKCFPVATIYRHFETFQEFIEYRNGDLTNCDLSNAFECNVDFSNYVINETTILPIQANKEVTYSVEKYYRGKKFYVTQRWRDRFGNVIKEYKHTFNYFFDFVAFLKGDLSEADLLLCDGLVFLKQWKNIDFKNAHMRSFLCDKFGLKYDIQAINSNLLRSFDSVEQNEMNTELLLQKQRDLLLENVTNNLSANEIMFDVKCQKVHYISDIHLMHKIQNAKCRSKDDILYVIQKIVNTIAHEIDSEQGTVLLIDGDVASDFGVFQLFVKMLSKELKGKTVVVFTLGNHELWSFPNLQIDQIALKYRTVLDKYGMYLLQNDILYKEDRMWFGTHDVRIHLIRYDELWRMNQTQISDRLRYARYVILGGLVFSGYNKKFNADSGIYQKTVDRNTEIKESTIFEDLYNHLRPILCNKNSIILTHTPKKDWCKEQTPDKNFVYVNGHTHKNFFSDDGEYRVYSDNQVGYHTKNAHLKVFLIDNDYDCFTDCPDGIFEITREQYIDFNHGKNISMRFQWEVNVLYMLKRKGYYCFIHKSKEGSFTILNGGARKKLEVQDIQYCYDNMEAMIATMKSPIEKFTAFQKRIANVVKRIGGIGKIHGCIIDIDFYNHIYVNPIDFSITGYWAWDIIDKVVYPSIPVLLEKNCPTIYGKYVKLLEGNSENSLVVKQQTNLTVLPQEYLDTDIYKASREINKMQKLNSHILTIWNEKVLHRNPKIGEPQED